MNKKTKSKVLLNLLTFSLFLFNVSLTHSQKVSSKELTQGTQNREAPVIFVLSPSSVVFPACSTYLIPFECKNLNNSPGFWYYRWTIGPGWTLSPGEYITTTNVFYLTPSSPTITPSAVTVMPIFGSTPHQTLVSNVYRAPFVSDAIITGNADLCLGSPRTFNLTGLKSGETVSWSLSNTNATLSNSTSTQTSVTILSPGNVNLVATITNSCNQSVTKTLPLHFGVPQFNSATPSNNQTGFNPSEPNVSSSYDGVECNVIRLNLSFSSTNILEYQWEKITTDVSWNTSNTSNSISLYPTCNKDFAFKVRARNICGWSQWEDIIYAMNRCTEDCPTNTTVSGNNFTISPNPVTQGDLLGINVNTNAPWFTTPVIFDPNLDPGLSGPDNNQFVTNYNPTVNIDIVNQNGNLIISFPNTVLPSSLDISTLPSGNYIVVIEYQGQIESYMIIKQ